MYEASTGGNQETPLAIKRLSDPLARKQRIIELQSIKIKNLESLIESLKGLGQLREDHIGLLEMEMERIKNV